MKKKSGIKYRDVSPILQILREKLLGREHNLHCRFTPFISPRSIPPAEIPRCPDYKYSNQYYYKRTAYDSVKPPVVAPIAEGPPIGHDPTKKAKGGGLSPDTICFPCPPTPGRPWWWDGHCYFMAVDDHPDEGPTTPAPSSHGPSEMTATHPPPVYCLPNVDQKLVEKNVSPKTPEK